MARKQVKKVLKGVKKKWYKVIAPKFLNSKLIGETPVSDQKLILGKVFNVNLMNIMGDPRKQGINLTLKVTSIENDTGITELTGYQIMPSSIKRLIRRQRDRIDQTLTCATSDNKKVIIKPLLLTRGKAQGSTLTAIRLAMRQWLAREIKKITLEKLTIGIISNSFQKEMKKGLLKIHPIMISEIRAFKIVGDIESKEEVSSDNPEPAKETPAIEQEKPIAKA